MNSKTSVSFGPRGSNVITYYSDDPEVMKLRFRDVKASIRSHFDIEVTNQTVLSVLLDLYWLHHESEEPAREDGCPEPSDGMASMGTGD